MTTISEVKQKNLISPSTWAAHTPMNQRERKQFTGALENVSEAAWHCQGTKLPNSPSHASTHSLARATHTTSTLGSSPERRAEFKRDNDTVSHLQGLMKKCVLQSGKKLSNLKVWIRVNCQVQMMNRLFCRRNDLSSSHNSAQSINRFSP